MMSHPVYTTRTMCTSPTTRRPNDFGLFSAPRERGVGVSYVIDYTLSLGFKTFTLVSALRFHPIPVHSTFFTDVHHRTRLPILYTSPYREITIQVVYERMWTISREVNETLFHRSLFPFLWGKTIFRKGFNYFVRLELCKSND